MKLDWNRIWQEFEKWVDNYSAKHPGSLEDWWGLQQQAIKRIVQKELQQTKCPYCGHVPDNC